jgi:hypothetical protein
MHSDMKCVNWVLKHACKFNIDCGDFENRFVFREDADTVVSNTSKNANPNWKRNRFAASVLPLYSRAITVYWRQVFYEYLRPYWPAGAVWG